MTPGICGFTYLQQAGRFIGTRKHSALLAHTISGAALKRVFAVFMLLVGLVMALW